MNTEAASQDISDEDYTAAVKMICWGFARTRDSNGFWGGSPASTAQKNLLRSLLRTSSIDAETIRIIRGYFNAIRGEVKYIPAYEVSCAIRILKGEVPQDMKAIAAARADALRTPEEQAHLDRMEASIARNKARVAAEGI